MMGVKREGEAGDGLRQLTTGAPPGDQFRSGVMGVDPSIGVIETRQAKVHTALVDDHTDQQSR